MIKFHREGGRYSTEIFTECFAAKLIKQRKNILNDGDGGSREKGVSLMVCRTTVTREMGKHHPFTLLFWVDLGIVLKRGVVRKASTIQALFPINALIHPFSLILSAPLSFCLSYSTSVSWNTKSLLGTLSFYTQPP